MITRQQVTEWLDELKTAWEGRDPERALKLFKDTRYYYERPFHAGTTQAEYREYWVGIANTYDIRFDYDIVAIDGQTACVHWGNWFRESPSGTLEHLDGVFVIVFNESGACDKFSQWWFQEKT